jgi:hypothetical protein
VSRIVEIFFKAELRWFDLVEKEKAWELIEDGL